MWPWKTGSSCSSTSSARTQEMSAVSSRSPLLAAAPHPSRFLRLKSGRYNSPWRSQEKMVIFVDKNVGGGGKLAALAASAAIELYRRHCTSNNGICNKWYNTGAKKIVVRVHGRELERIADNARKQGLPVAVITGDNTNSNSNNRSNSKTALSILGNSQKIDAVTASLRLSY